MELRDELAMHIALGHALGAKLHHVMVMGRGGHEEVGVLLLLLRGILGVEEGGLVLAHDVVKHWLGSVMSLGRRRGSHKSVERHALWLHSGSVSDCTGGSVDKASSLCILVLGIDVGLGKIGLLEGER